MQSSPFPDDTALVMAHPDDEALWASSVLSGMDRIVLCFGDVASRPGWSDGRRRSAAEYPLANATHLGIPESEVFGGAAWPLPVETEYGLAVNQGPSSRRGFSGSRYRDNWGRLVAELRPLLAGRSCVITHSPWGEYGHEEHIQVFRAVAHLKAEMGFTLWIPGYVSNKTFPLMTRHIATLDGVSPALETDIELGTRLKALYANNGCWTWFDDYRWPSHEHFHYWCGLDGGSRHARAGGLFPMNLLWLDPQPPSRRSQPFLRQALRRARRLLWR